MPAHPSSACAYPQCLSAPSQTPSSTGVPILGCHKPREGTVTGQGSRQSRKTLQVGESTQTIYRIMFIWYLNFLCQLSDRQPVAQSLCKRNYSLFLPKSQWENLSHRSHQSRLNPCRGSVGEEQPRARSCCHRIRPRTLQVRRRKAEM